MPWREHLVAVPMARVALVAPEPRFRRVLVEVVDAGVFEPDPVPEGAAGPFATAAAGAVGGGAEAPPARLSAEPVDVEELVADGARALLLGEAELERRVAAAHRDHGCAVLPGWIPTRALDPLGARLAPLGGAVASITPAPGRVPPTATTEAAMSARFRPLVSAYATVPYRDVDPTLFAAVAYIVMFGMMFGDVGHGFAIVALGVAARRAGTGWLHPAQRVWSFLVGAGVAAVGFGFLYGECFGPTGIVPTLWIEPLDDPETLLVAGLVVGCGLLTVTLGLATVNRWREGGPALAVYSAAGLGGAMLFAGAGGVVGGLLLDAAPLRIAGFIAAVAGLIAVFVGLLAGVGWGLTGLAQAVVELFDTILRLGSNVVSFARLAAFGLTHAVITGVVWDGTVALWETGGGLGPIAAVVLFTAGNLAAIALGALVAAIQALRLEYYELFSRLFVAEGRPFAPWHLPVDRSESS